MRGVRPENVVVWRCEVLRVGGGWLRLEADDEVVIIATNGHRVQDAVYLSRHDMETLVAAWLGWQELRAVPATREESA